MHRLTCRSEASSDKRDYDELTKREQDAPWIKIIGCENCIDSEIRGLFCGCNYYNYRVFNKSEGDICHKYNLDKFELEPNKTFKELEDEFNKKEMLL